MEQFGPSTCDQLGPKCLQILGMHNLTGSDTISYLYGKGKVSALKTTRAGVDSPPMQPMPPMEAGQAFFCALYGQQHGTTMSEARYRMHTRKSGKLIKIMPLPPTEQNLFLHILRAHLQTILVTADHPPGPTDLMDVVRCGCKAEGKTCGTANYSCHHGKI